MSTSCGSSAGYSPAPSEKKFFDLKEYFQAETDRLNAEDPKLKKEVTFNGSMEVQTVQPEDFSQELKFFTGADINQTALLEKYGSDSLFVDGQLDRLTHQAVDSSLNVRKIVIDYEKGEIVQIDVYKKQKSFVGSSQQHLRYKPREGYSINSLQKTILSKPQQLKIASFFTN